MPETRPEIRAAREPLTPTEFKRALEQGLGRAILCLQQHDSAPYKEIVLEACLFDTTYDQHCGETKAAYLLEALNAFEDKSKLKARVVKRCSNSSLHEDEAPDRDLLLELAKEQHSGARAALYKEFLQIPSADLDWSSGKEIVKLDGLEGLLFAAERFGKAKQINPEWELPWFHVRDLSKELGADVVDVAFQNKGSASALFYLECSRQEILKPHKGRDYTQTPVNSVIKVISGKEGLSKYSLGIWGTYASDEDFARVAEHIADLREPDQLSRGLSVFEKRPFPLDYSALIPLCWHEDENVVWQAAEALSHFSDPSIRAASLHLRENAETLRESLSLLEKNMTDDDWFWLEAVTHNLSDDETETLNIRVRDVIEANPDARAQQILIQLYESGSCAMCRSGIANLLNDLGCLPTWMLEELQEDSYSYLREEASHWKATT